MEGSSTWLTVAPTVFSDPANVRAAIRKLLAPHHTAPFLSGTCESIPHAQFPTMQPQWRSSRLCVGDDAAATFCQLLLALLIVVGPDCLLGRARYLKLRKTRRPRRPQRHGPQLVHHAIQRDGHVPAGNEGLRARAGENATL